MYNVILVDDEIGGMESLKSYIDDLLDGFNVIACLKNGEDAVNFIMENCVDLVLTDIKMPVMNGLELAKWINENKPEIKVVIFSAYSEFEYAKQAIKYNVYEYLLKIVDVDEFVNLMKKVKSELDESNQNNSEMLRIKREYFFTNVRYKVYGEEKIDSFYSDIQIPIPVKNLKCDIFDIQHLGDGEKITEAVYNVYERANQGIYPVCLDTRDNNIQFVFLSDDRIEGDIHNPGYFLKDILKLDVEISKVRTCNIYELSSAAEYVPRDVIDLILSLMSEGDYQSAKTLSNDLMESINLKQDSAFVNDEIFDVIKTTKTDEDLVSGLECYMLSDVSKSIKAYIEANYSEPVTVKQISEMLHINTAYMGRVFKNQTGMTVRSYINEIRCKKAIELMHSGMNIDEISYVVGYMNVRHFRRIFKEITGYTPNDYRQNIIK